MMDAWDKSIERHKKKLSKMNKPIDSFLGEYRFLSNFYMYPVHYDGVLYPSNEHAFVAAKTEDKELRAEMLRTCRTANEAKKFGRYQIKLRKGWDDIRIDVMKELLREKFTNSNLREKLLATGNRELIEGNTWGDKFWGVCDSEGKNNLGKLLMEIRKELRDLPLFS